MDILFEWEHLDGTKDKFLLQLPYDDNMFVLALKYFGAKLKGRRVYHVTVCEDTTETSEGRAVYKSLSMTHHPHGTLTTNQQWVDKHKVEALLGIIPSGDERVYRSWMHFKREKYKYESERPKQDTGTV